MNKTRLLSRLYFFVPYNISEIQKGIQAGHTAMEYAIRYGNTKLFKDFVKYDKTWIILNGGVTRKDQCVTDTNEMNTIGNILFNNSIPYGFFREPDLNDTLTAVCFICDERVYDFVNYPDYDVEKEDCTSKSYNKWVKSIGGNKNLALRELIKGKRLA